MVYFGVCVCVVEGGGGGGGKSTPSPVKNLLELCYKFQIWYVSTHTYVVSVNISFSAKALIILLMSAFFCKKSAFSGKNGTFTQSNSLRAALERFSFCFQF